MTPNPYSTSPWTPGCWIRWGVTRCKHNAKRARGDIYRHFVFSRPRALPSRRQSCFGRRHYLCCPNRNRIWSWSFRGRYPMTLRQDRLAVPSRWLPRRRCWCSRFGVTVVMFLSLIIASIAFCTNIVSIAKRTTGGVESQPHPTLQTEIETRIISAARIPNTMARPLRIPLILPQFQGVPLHVGYPDATPSLPRRPGHRAGG